MHTNSYVINKIIYVMKRQDIKNILKNGKLAKPKMLWQQIRKNKELNKLYHSLKLFCAVNSIFPWWTSCSN